MKTLIRLLAATMLVACLPAQALDLKLRDKIVLVTGSTSNIGYATARTFLREGATVIVNSNDPNAVA
jgi:glutamate dehydrogenase/leucine dehydrogenase